MFIIVFLIHERNIKSSQFENFERMKQRKNRKGKQLTQAFCQIEKHEEALAANSQASSGKSESISNKESQCHLIDYKMHGLCHRYRNEVIAANCGKQDTNQRLQPGKEQGSLNLLIHLSHQKYLTLSVSEDWSLAKLQQQLTEVTGLTSAKLSYLGKNLVERRGAETPLSAIAPKGAQILSLKLVSLPESSGLLGGMEKINSSKVKPAHSIEESSDSTNQLLMPVAIGTSEQNTGSDFARSNQVASSPARPTRVTQSTINLKQEKKEQKERWEDIDEEIKDQVNKRLMKSAIFRDIVFGGNEGKEDEMKAMFTPEQLERVRKLDLYHACNLDDPMDCLDLLNALPSREKRKIVQRINERIDTFQNLPGQRADEVREAFDAKFGGEDVYSPDFHFPNFENTPTDLSILKYLFIGDHFKSQAAINPRKSEQEMLKTIVKEFCPKLSDQDPVRIVKLLEILDTREAIRLCVALPECQMSAQHISKRSSVKPYVIDFINDCKKLFDMKERAILEQLLIDPDNEDMQISWIEKKSQEELKNEDDGDHLAGFKLTHIHKSERPDFLDKLSKIQTRNIDIKTFGKFLQSIPRPDVKNSGQSVSFVTLQGQPLLYKASEENTKIRPPETGHKETVKTIVSDAKIFNSQEEIKFSETWVDQEDSQRKLKNLLKPPLQQQYYNEQQIEQIHLQEQVFMYDRQDGKSLLALWHYREDINDFQCVKSVEIYEPICFRDMNYFTGEVCQRIFLYKGLNDDIFWFSYNEQERLVINILDKVLPEKENKKAKKVEYIVSEQSLLYEHITKGNYRMDDKSFENPVPTLIQEENGNLLCVFTHSTGESPVPTVYFYDTSVQMEIAQATGASIFLNYSKQKKKLQFYCEKYIASQKDIFLQTMSNFNEPNRKASFQKLQSKAEICLNSPMHGLNWFSCQQSFSEIREKKFNLGQYCFRAFSDQWSKEKQCGVPSWVNMADNLSFRRLAVHKKEDVDPFCKQCGKKLLTYSNDKKQMTEGSNVGLELISAKIEPAELVDKREFEFEEGVSMDYKTGFKLIENCNSVWDKWSTASIQVRVFKEQDGHLITYALIKNSFDPNNQSIRVIQVVKDEDSGFEKIRMITKEKKQYFVAEDIQANKGQNSAIVKFFDKEDGFRHIRMYKNSQIGDRQQLQGIKMKNNDPMQFQNPYRGKNQLIFSSINEKDGTFTWYTVPISSSYRISGKQEPAFSSQISNELQYCINFPIMCHLIQDHQDQHVILKNLANKDNQERKVQFSSLRFITFLKANNIYAESRISFLAKAKNTHSEDLCIIVMMYDMPYDSTKKHEDLTKWSINRYTLNPFKGLKEKLNQVKSAFLVQMSSTDGNLRNEKVQPPIIIVTDESIFLAQKDKISDVRTKMLGTKSENKLSKLEMIRGFNNHFYYIEKSASTCFLVELSIEFQKLEKQWTHRTRNIYSSPNGAIIAFGLDTDFTWKTDAVWSKSGKLMFGKEEKKDLGRFVKNQIFIIDSQHNILKLKQGEDHYDILWKRNLSHMTDLLNVLDQMSQAERPKISISDRCLTIRGVHYIYDSGHSCQVSLSGEEATWSIFSSSDIENTNFQVHEAKKKENGIVKYQIVIKDKPSSRKCNFVDQKSQRDVLLCGFIAEDKLLLKMRTDRQQLHYWTLMDSQGFIQPLPTTLDRILEQQDWTKMNTTIILNGQTQLLLKSDECIAGFKFSQAGVLLESHLFDANHPEVNFIARTVRCDYEGNLYQLALISPDSKQTNAKNSNPDLQRHPQGHQGVMYYRSDARRSKILNRVIFDFADDQRSDKDMHTQMVVCGENICWRPQSQPKIMIMHMRDLQQGTGSSGGQFNRLNLRQIDLNSMIGASITDTFQSGQNPTVRLHPVSLYWALHSQQETKLHEAKLKRRMQALQVTIDSRGIIYNLQGKQKPQSKDRGTIHEAIQEIPAMHHLLNAEEYVETGVVMNKVKNKYREGGILSHKFTREIRSNNIGTYYYVMSGQHNASQAAMHDDYCGEESLSPFQGGYKSYSELDLIEMKRIIDLLLQNKVSNSMLDISVVFSTLKGHSVFSFFEGEWRVYERIKEQLEDRDPANGKEDYDFDHIESPVFRKVVQILVQKTKLEESETEGKLKQYTCTSVLDRSFQDPDTRDILLEIADLCPNFSLFDVIADQAETEEIMKTATSTIIALLQTCFVESKSTRKLSKKIHWPENLRIITFIHDSCVIDDEIIKNHISKNYKVKGLKHSVKVQRLNVKWLFQGSKNFKDFVKIITQLNSTNLLYDTEFVSILLEQFWRRIQLRLGLFYFLPFVIFGILGIFFLSANLQLRVDPKEAIDVAWIWILGILTFLLSLHQIRVEIISLLGFENKIDYINAYNINDILMLSTMNILIFEFAYVELSGSLEQIPLWHKVAMSALATFFITLKLYDWFRLFQQTAFFIQLITQTLRDIVSFMILLLTALFICGLPIYMLNFYRYEGQKLIQNDLNNALANIFMNQYYLILGEFHNEYFSKQPHDWLCFLLFVLATFFTQITMLNMLIAIMGDTFERVTENKVVHARRTKLTLLAEYADVLGRESEDSKFTLFVIKPQEEDLNELENWEGSLNSMRLYTAKIVEELKIDFTKKMEDIAEKIESSANREAEQDDGFKHEVFKSLKSLDLKFSSKLEKLLYNASMARDSPNFDATLPSARRQTEAQRRSNRHLQFNRVDSGSQESAASHVQFHPQQSSNNQERIINKLQQNQEDYKNQISGLGQKLESVEQSVNGFNQKLNSVEQSVQAIISKLDGFESYVMNK